MKNISCVLFTITLIGCGQLKKPSVIEDKSFTRSASNYEYNILEKEKQQVICHGDVPSYRLINTELPDGGNEKDVLAYALLMANKYDDAWAHYTVYEILKSMGGCENHCRNDKLNCLDDKTRDMALEYLLLALDKGALPHAKEEYDRLKSEGIME